MFEKSIENDEIMKSKIWLTYKHISKYLEGKGVS